jgi:integrase
VPRKASWPPKVQWHKASNRDRIRVKNVDYYLGPHGSAEAKREYARLIVLLAEAAPAAPQPTPADPFPLTVAELVELWRVHALKKFGAGSGEMGEYDRSLEVALEKYAGTPARLFDADRLEECRERMTRPAIYSEETDEHGKPIRTGGGWGVCRNTANQRSTRIKGVWRWAERKKHVPAGAWSQLRTLASLPPSTPGVRDTAPRKPCSWEDVQKVADLLRPPTKAILLLCWHTGSRPGEPRQLKASEVDTSGEVWTLRPSKHKNRHRGHARAVQLCAAAREIITPFIAGKEPDDYVFPPDSAEPGRCYRKQSLTQAISRAAKRAGVHLFAYQCRHSFRQRVSRKHGLEAARAAMGHRSVEQTAHYAEGVDEELARKVARESA